VDQGEVLVVDRKDSTSTWTLEKVTLEPEQEVNPDKLVTLTTSLGDLKIVGVRPKPAGLTRDLKATGDGAAIRLTNASLMSLQDKGFYLTKDGRLLSNQGDVRVATDQGVVYTLRFGEVVFASGDDLTAGEDDEKAGANKAKDNEKEKKDKGKPDGGAESRYLFVTVDFDELQIPPPASPPAETASELPPDVFQRDAAEIAALEKAKKDKEEKDKAEFERKVKEGKELAKQLTDRFAAWYYVIPGDGFRNVMLDREALVRQKPPKTATPERSAPLNFNQDPAAPMTFPHN
jgi:hypothetical protein